jgi:hypothetical protein
MTAFVQRSFSELQCSSQAVAESVSQAGWRFIIFSGQVRELDILPSGTRNA